MKNLVLLFALLSAFTLCKAQEETDPPQWLEVSSLYMEAYGTNSEGYALRQFLLIPANAMENQEELSADLETFNEEYSRKMKSSALQQGEKIQSEALKQMAEQMEKMRALVKTHPEMASALEEMEKAYAEVKSQHLDIEAAPVMPYSVNPASILKRLTALAVNRKAYTGWMDVGNSLFAVTEAPRYFNPNGDYFENRKDKVAEKDYYTWGVINEKGHQILPAQYASFDIYPDEDIMFLTRDEGNGVPKVGAVSYSGQVRIPFIYDKLIEMHFSGEKAMAFKKNGKIGWVGMNGNVIMPFEYVQASRIGGGWEASKDGKNFGVVNNDGILVVPLKYKSYWNGSDDTFEMERFDNKLDIYSKQGQLIGSKEAPNK